MKPIETTYAGHRFRSRLEARWAVFFDHLGVEWEYEPEGYIVGGRAYLPDFRLTSLRLDGPVLFEVKGAEIDDDEYELMLHRLATEATVIVAVGQHARPDRVGRVGRTGPVDGSGLARFGGGTPDTVWWTVCPECAGVGCAADAEVRAMACCGKRSVPYGMRNGNDPRILAALTAARSARFEHGESGAPHTAAPEAEPTAPASALSGLLERLFATSTPPVCGDVDPDSGVSCTRVKPHHGRHMGVNQHHEAQVWSTP